MLGNCPRSPSLLFCSILASACADTGSPATDTATPTSTDSTSSAGSTSTGFSTTTATTALDPTTGTTGGVDHEGCDPWQQDCPAGTKCMAYAMEGEPAFTGTKCTPVVEAPGAAGDPCTVQDGWWTGIDDCDHGLACWDINHADNTGHCVPLCTGSADNYSCPESDELCVFWVPGLAHVCLPGCDPLLQDCDPGQACLPNWASGGQEFVCFAEYSFEEGQEFDPCEFSNVCDPGLMCAPPDKAVECDQDAGGCCLAFCDLSAPDCAGEGAVCTSFYELAGGSPPPDHADVGLCLLPG